MEILSQANTEKNNQSAYKEYKGLNWAWWIQWRENSGFSNLMYRKHSSHASWSQVVILSVDFHLVYFFPSSRVNTDEKQVIMLLWDWDDIFIVHNETKH